MRRRENASTKSPCPDLAQLIVFDTHPIQYRSPIFRDLQKRDPNFHVFFFNDHFNDRRIWYKEKKASRDIGLKNELREGFANSTLHTESLGAFGKLRLLSQILDENRSRAVLFYGYYMLEHWILWVLCRRKGIRSIFIGETFRMEEGWRGRIKSLILRFFLKRVSAIVSIGDKNTAHYKKLGVPSTKLVSAKYAANTHFFSADRAVRHRLREETRKKLAIDPNAFVLLFVGRLFSRKRPADVLALHRTLSEYPIHTIVAGAGQLLPTLKQIGQNEARLHFTGFLDQYGLKPLYCAADLLVVPSEFETWGLVINEAFSTGLPAIVTDTCGAADDLVIPGKTGFLFGVGDITGAANQIKSLIENPDLHRALGENAQNLEREEFSLGQMENAIWQAAHL